MSISKKKVLGVVFVIVVIVLSGIALGPYILSYIPRQEDSSPIIDDRELDDDNDGLTNHDEIYIHHTNPNKTDTDDGGVTDIDEVLTYPHYGMDPNNATDDQALIAKIPNVVANEWKLDNMTKDYTLEKKVNLSMADPLIKYLAEHSEIKWTDSGENKGKLLVDGSLVWGGIPNNIEGLNNPSFYFTHGRKGKCGDTSIATFTILKSMGIKTIEVPMINSETNVRHIAPAFLKNDKIYIVNFGQISTWDDFFEETDYVVDSDFDQNWYMND